VQGWSDSAGAILICGRYEGVDQRFIDAHVDVQISLGDFVLSGGEIAAMALIDAVARLQPGVLGDQESHHFDSFNPALDGLLDCPTTPGPSNGRGRRCRRCCCPVTTSRLRCGDASSGCTPQPRCAPSCLRVRARTAHWMNRTRRFCVQRERRFRRTEPARRWWPWQVARLEAATVPAFV